MSGIGNQVLGATGANAGIEGRLDSTEKYSSDTRKLVLEECRLLREAQQQGFAEQASHLQYLTPGLVEQIEYLHTEAIHAKGRRKQKELKRQYFWRNVRALTIAVSAGVVIALAGYGILEILRDMMA